MTDEAQWAEFLRGLHQLLRAPLDDAGRMVESYPTGLKHMKSDTAFALGGAMGAMAKACALLGRDVDDSSKLLDAEPAKAGTCTSP